jgi:hypothetical protein
LEAVDFERVTSTSSKAITGKELSASGEGKLGWSWLANVTGKAALAAKAGTEESEVREKIISSPSPDLLIPLLTETTYVLIVEDFHYLDDSQKILLFQQWKRFVDSEVTIIVLGTTHRAVDIANSNPDLVGRIAQIDVTQWSEDDLKMICTLGFDYLKTSISPALKKLIATESVGLPILAQQICLQAMNGKDIYTVRDARKREPTVTQKELNGACHEVARSKYTQFATYYNTLIRGPREKLRKYKTYELVLACFTIDPIQFALTRHEIDTRLSKVAGQGTLRPPAASVNSTLGALKEFQDKRGFELLEWRSSEDRLYIVEPSFLFYVRWRKDKNSESGIQLDLFEVLLVEWTDPLNKKATARRTIDRIYSDVLNKNKDVSN